MPRVLLVADAPWAVNEVRATLTGADIVLDDHSDPATVATTVSGGEYDAVIVDLQVGSMGGMAITRAVREAESIGGAPRVPVILLLDRGADVFLARRAGAAAWVTKPFTSHDINGALSLALDQAVRSET